MKLFMTGKLEEPMTICSTTYYDLRMKNYVLHIAFHSSIQYKTVQSIYFAVCWARLRRFPVLESGSKQ